MAETGGPGAAEPSIAAGHAEAHERCPFDDTRDFEDAERGFLGTAEEPVLRGGDGAAVWDLAAYAFLDQDCPDTASPSLWRQSRLVARHGLFEVTGGVYQVRGFDLSNMTIVEGDRGVLVIDPLISAETAAAALALYRRHRGDRPVSGVLYTHSHVDHFGGVKGVIGQEDADGGVPVIAPEGFLAHAVSENVYAGTAMGRRAAYMYGAALPAGARGRIGAGLGQTTSTGTTGLIPPTLDVTRTGQSETVDGIRMVFQLTPGTEAPAELNIHFPDRAALCMAENATHTLHNLLTLRRRPGPRPACVGPPPHRGHPAVRRRHRRGLRLPPLADVGPRTRPRLPRRAAGPVRLPARPDPAHAERGDDVPGDRRGPADAAGPGTRLAHPRLLRLGQP
ncbi:hypothetical protein ACE1SV_04360 [Streptomyces sennicomposti]